ncbi:hypothetical protein RN001_016137 [Aquatica leii]|uniref:Homeobox domain-containing protein n=1 Tax=Aquatica leii TaxID=1421715 RepID=A0AAN7QB46_9COLE|nr:hypothetical protein RN001_016137 [Aquatica leii]
MSAALTRDRPSSSGPIMIHEGRLKSPVNSGELKHQRSKSLTFSPSQLGMLNADTSYRSFRRGSGDSKRDSEIEVQPSNIYLEANLQDDVEANCVARGWRQLTNAISNNSVTQNSKTVNKRNAPALKKKKKKNKPFSKLAKLHLTSWLLNNTKNPYATEAEKKRLSLLTNLTVRQITNWMINARRRLLPKLLATPRLRNNLSQIKTVPSPTQLPDPSLTSKLGNSVKVVKKTAVNLGKRRKNSKRNTIKKRLQPNSAKKKKEGTSAEATAYLLNWLQKNIDNPYPDRKEKLDISVKTNLELKQINYWFANARRRILPRLLENMRNNQSTQNLNSLQFETSEEPLLECQHEVTVEQGVSGNNDQTTNQIETLTPIESPLNCLSEVDFELLNNWNPLDEVVLNQFEDEANKHSTNTNIENDCTFMSLNETSLEYIDSAALAHINSSLESIDNGILTSIEASLISIDNDILTNIGNFEFIDDAVLTDMESMQ